MNTATLIAFAVYLVGLVAIAVAAWMRTRDATDYALGGRTLGPAVAALSAGASDMSGWLLLGLPGAIYASGLVEGWIAVGLLTGAFANWCLVAAPLRRATEAADDSVTLPGFLAHHLAGDAHPNLLVALRAVATTLIIFFFTFYVASGLVAGARLFESTLDLPYLTALWIGAGIIVAYTVAGGFLAVAWTDFFQGLLMLAALLAVPILLFGLDMAPYPERVVAAPLEGLTVIGWLSLVAWGLGYFGQPHVLARFMALEKAEDVPTATGIGMGWMLLVTAGAVGVGLGGQAVFDAPLADRETVFIALTQLLFHPVIAGIVLAAILAAVMSTIDSQLLVASTSLAEDLYHPLQRTPPSQQTLVRVGRAAVVIVAGIALWLATDPDSRVLGLVSYAWAGLGASFGPVILAALHWRGMNAAGALAGMIAGGTTVVVWGALDGGLFELYELLPGFLVGGAATIVVSRLVR